MSGDRPITASEFDRSLEALQRNIDNNHREVMAAIIELKDARMVERTERDDIRDHVLNPMVLKMGLLERDVRRHGDLIDELDASDRKHMAYPVMSGAAGGGVMHGIVALAQWVRTLFP